MVTGRLMRCTATTKMAASAAWRTLLTGGNSCGAVASIGGMGHRWTHAASALSRPQPQQPQPAVGTRLFQTSAHALSRYPALVSRIPRKSHAKTLRKIAMLKARLGDDYAIIGRDKRRSPLTERRSPSKPSQPEPPTPKPIKIAPYLASRKNPRPLDIVPGKILEKVKTLPLAEADAATTETQSTGVSSRASSSGIRDNNIVRHEKQITSPDTLLCIPDHAVPVIPAEITNDLRVQAEKLRTVPADAAALTAAAADANDHNAEPAASALPQYGLEPATAVGPFYQFGVTPKEIKNILIDTPETLAWEGVNTADNLKEQAEMVRRILDLENSSERSIRKFNIARSVEMFQRKHGDTGSPEVQAAVFSVRINALKAHVAANSKDTFNKQQLQRWISKRMLILKYLRRKDLAKYVETCRAIGVDPDTVLRA